MLKSVLFDLDGVLIDTEAVYTDFWAAVDHRFPTEAPDFAHVIKGSTLPSILNTYFPREQHPAIVEMLHEMENGMQYTLFDGAADLLEALGAAGITTAIVTSSNRPKMDVVFDMLPLLRRCTTVLVTDEDVVNSKPDPQGYLVAAGRLGVTPHECVVVEDSVAGLRAAVASGAAVAAVATTNPHNVIEPMADIVGDTIADFTVDCFKSLVDSRQTMAKCVNKN